MTAPCGRGRSLPIWVALKWTMLVTMVVPAMAVLMLYDFVDGRVDGAWLARDYWRRRRHIMSLTTRL